MNRSKQAGFSIVEAVIVVAVLGIIGAAGWFVYQHNSAKPVSAANDNRSTNQQTTTTTPAPTVTYLDVKEWGVKLPLSDSIKDAYYVVATNSADTMWLGLTSLDSGGCAAALGNTNGASAPVAALIRVLPTDREPVSGKLYTDLYPGVTVGSYYYAYLDGTKNKTCASATTLQTISSAFVVAAKATVAATAN